MNSLTQNGSEQWPVALVLGTGICGLGTIRSLKEEKHIPIIVLGNEDRGLAQYSKYIDAFYPCDERDVKSIYSTFKKISETYDKIIPIPTGSDFWVNILISAPVPYNNFITDLKPEYAELMKKSVQQELAAACHVPYPDSIEVKNEKDIDTACATLRFPCVVKPVSRVDKDVPFRIRSYQNKEELHKDITPLLGTCDFIVSSEITGPDKNIYTYGSFAVNGIVKAEYSGRKLTQRPMKFGVAGIAESIQTVPELKAYSEALLKKSNFSGISQIEFKLDEQTGDYYLMEINPRIWLWMHTATVSGVNIVRAYYNYLAGKKWTSGKQHRKCMFINGLSLFDNTFREKNITWLRYYLTSRFVRHIYAIKDRKDPKPYQIERRRFIKKIIHKTKNNM